MDAPLHFVDGARSIDQIPLDATVGPARIIEIADPVAIRRAELELHDIQPGERLLFKTANSGRCWGSDCFYEDFTYIAEDAALFLAERQVRSVGIDYLSVGGFSQDMVETHVALLGAGIWVIEGLDLSKAPPGPCELICLPLKIIGSDGSPARAILRPVVPDI
jgi:arylformamidase